MNSATREQNTRAPLTEVRHSGVSAVLPDRTYAGVVQFLVQRRKVAIDNLVVTSFQRGPLRV